MFINGLPLVFIEVKKPNNIGGMVAESTRICFLEGSVEKFPFIFKGTGDLSSVGRKE